MKRTIRISASVVIPFTRITFIEEIIKRIKNQNKNTQIIVVGKGSAFVKKYGVISIESKKLLNPSQARNLGAKSAKREVIIFLDDDCLPQKDWLENNIKTLQNKSIGAVGGSIIGGSKKYFAKSLDYSNFSFVQNLHPKEMPISSASFAIRKEVFEKIGGFNEKITIGEDTDLSMRLRSKGYKTVYDPKIKVLHFHKRESLQSLLKYQFKNGKVKGLSIENKYPVGFWFIFLKKISNPYFFFPFILPFSILAVLVSVSQNFKNTKKIIYYAPGIFLGKLSCQCGIFVWTLKRPKTFA